MEDLKPEFFLKAGDKERLLAHYAGKSERAVVHVTIPVVSGDMTHDNAMMQHVYHHIIFPLVKLFEISPGTINREVGKCDGCKAQFKLWGLAELHSAGRA